MFPEIKGKKREFTSPGSWNGNEIKGNTKNVLFLLPLKAGAHKIKFWVDGMPVLEEIKIYKIDENEIDLMTNKTVMSDKFLDVIFKNLKIEKLGIKAKANIGSKLEIKIDGKTEKNPKYKKFEKWYWYGQELKGSSKEYSISDGLDEEQHSFELRGQGKSEIESIKIKINISNIIYSRGVVKLYKDIVIRDDVNLRASHTDDSESLLMLRDGEKVGIVNEQVKGKYIENLSKIWHEVIVRNTKGYILSSYMEIEGQEREKIIDLIKEKCLQYGVDANIMLAIASHESHFKPFAESYKGPLGIFQLSEDTRNDFEVVDPYDFYQNISGGVQNYKDIEKRITGRGDILIKRLVAWHDGPTTTIRKINDKTFNYEKLSDKTKKFVKSVLLNLEKKDWYHILSLPVVILFFLATAWFGRELPEYKTPIYIQPAIAVSYNWLNNYQSTLNFSSIFDDDKYDLKDHYSYFPNVFIDEVKDQVIFLNSEKKIAGTFDVERLDIDRIQGVEDIVSGYDWPNHTSISYVVLENPKNIFYFGALNSHSCGASNCHYVIYKFDANKNVLKVIDTDIFGQIMGLYLSPDLTKIAVVSGSAGGFCNNSYDLVIFDTTTFTKNKINQFYDSGYSSQNLKDFTWKNNDEVQFTTSYFKCLELEEKKVIWLYNINDQTIKELKSEIIYHEAG